MGGGVKCSLKNSPSRRRNRSVGAFRAFVNDIALGAVRGL
jgi:hypothetical protein